MSRTALLKVQAEDRTAPSTGWRTGIGPGSRSLSGGRLFSSSIVSVCPVVCSEQFGMIDKDAVSGPDCGLNGHNNAQQAINAPYRVFSLHSTLKLVKHVLR